MQVPHCPLNGSQNIDINVHYPNPCINPLHLDLNTTQIIFNLIYSSVVITGVADDRINDKGFPTFDGCKSVVNTGPSHPTWYSGSVIWQRLTNWKLPLLQLFFLTALPAIGTRYRALILARVLGNPICTIQDQLLKLSDCQYYARQWQRYLRESTQLQAIPRMLVQRADITWAGVPPRARNDNYVQLSHRMETDLDTFKEWEFSWKSITMIVASYGEFGAGIADYVSNQIYAVLQVRNLGGGVNAEFMEICRHTAEALAADRYTTLVPIFAAQAFFVLAIGTPFIQIRASSPVTAGVFLNIEAYSIAFSMMFFWMIFTTYLSAVIGVSQSFDRIPRILNRFRTDLEKLNMSVRVERTRLGGGPNSVTAGHRSGEEQEAYNDQIETLEQLDTALSSILVARLRIPNSEHPDSATPNLRMAGESDHVAALRQDEIYSGRIPSWQPGRWDHRLSRQDRRFQPPFSFHMGSAIFAIFILTFSCSMGFLLAWKVPPHGFECRHICLIIMWALWILSYLVSEQAVIWMFRGGPRRNVSRKPLLSEWAKDTIVAVLESAAVILTQCGILNSCACYTLWGRVDMPLSQTPSVADELYRSFNTTYPEITFLTIVGLGFVLPIGVLLYYRDAARVFLQKDTGRTHSESLQNRRWRLYARCVQAYDRGIFGRLYQQLYV